MKIVEYENLVLNTESVFRDLANFLGIQIATFTNIESPAKDHGGASGRDAAVAKIKNKAYMITSPWSSDGYAAAVCHNLDSGMMAAHHIQISPTEERTFASDCE